MAKQIRLDVVTPERMVYSADVDMVIARAVDGDIGILPGHAPLITALDVWPMRIMDANGERQVSVCSGFMEVRPEKVTVLASRAELPEEIDIERAQAAKDRAENRLQGNRSEIDVSRAEAALRRAIIRLRVAEHRTTRE